MAAMKDEYTSIPLDEGTEVPTHGRRSFRDRLRVGVPFVVVAIAFAVGYIAGHGWSQPPNLLPEHGNGLLTPQDLLPEIPTVPVTFTFPTKYEETGPEADELWSDMMPVGAGFIRVPYPRRYDMPESKAIEDDAEQSEIYSLSITHQLHCLAVLRHVIIKYEHHDKSRFAGDGHEYHCLDYIRQAVLCAGDTTLDFAEPVTEPDGTVRRLGFMGTGSTHQCRSWDVIRQWAVENRSGNRTGIV